MKEISYEPGSRNRRYSNTCGKRVISLPNNKILDWSKSKAFTDDKINVAKLVISLPDRIENIVGKGENAGYQHFLLFPIMPSKAFFLRVVQSCDSRIPKLHRETLNPGEFADRKPLCCL